MIPGKLNSITPPLVGQRFKTNAPPGLQPPPLPPADLNSVNLKPNDPDPNDHKPVAKKALTAAGIFVGLGMLAAAGGGLFSTAAHSVSIPAPTPQEQVKVTTTQSHAPTTLLDSVSHPLQFEGVRLDKAPSTHSLGNAPVQIKRFEGTDTKKAADGSTLTHKYSFDRVDAKGDALVMYLPDQVEDLGASFEGEATTNWQTYSHLSPAGNAGRFVSVSALEGGDTGGVSNSATTTLATIDTAQGRQITLDELLSPKELQDVHAQIDKALQAPRAENYRQDSRTIHELTNRNFGLHQEAGKTHLTVQIPAVTQADHGKVAEFSFVLPSTVNVN